MDADVQAALDLIQQRLDYIEEHLEKMGKYGAQIAYVPMGRADHRPDDPGNVPQEVRDLALAGNRREAMIRYRELTGADGVQAMRVVDHIIAGG
jgi:hypothetical protein